MTEKIDPRQLIDKHSLDEHIKFADSYFDDREDHLYLYQKPFHHPINSAPVLSNLGQLLHLADLQAGMTVLDFAAGSCWLSRILVEFGCNVTSCDASPQALAIGEELFRKYPPVNQHSGFPSFVEFKGEKFEEADTSFDRIIVNDAFHHIPNTKQVLKEFYRILKPGGRVTMSEPGRHHSQSPDSQFEMATYNVIENDFILESIWQEAESAGFDRIHIAPVLRHRKMGMDEYLSLVSGETSPALCKVLEQDTINHSIFCLYKDAEVTADNFDEAAYLARYPDVAAAVQSERLKSGYKHYLLHGKKEGRSPFLKENA